MAERKSLERMFRNEAILQVQLSHKNIVSVKAVCLAPFSLALEYCGGGELYDYIAEKDVEYGWDTLLKIAMDIAEGLAYLHSTFISPLPPLTPSSLFLVILIDSLSLCHLISNERRQVISCSRLI